MINVDVSVKKNRACEKDYVGILVNVFVKMENI